MGLGRGEGDIGDRKGLTPVPSVPQTSQDICCVVFAIFNVIWSTLFLEEWKRRGAEFAYKWGTLDTPPESIEEPRPQFRVSPWGGPAEPPAMRAPSSMQRTITFMTPQGSVLGPSSTGVTQGPRGCPRHGEGHTLLCSPPIIRALSGSAP